jgi:hypothetical protein
VSARALEHFKFRELREHPIEDFCWVLQSFSLADFEAGGLGLLAFWNPNSASRCETRVTFSTALGGLAVPIAMIRLRQDQEMRIYCSRVQRCCPPGVQQPSTA